MRTRSWQGATFEWLLSAMILFLFSVIACAPILWYGASSGDSLVTNLIWLNNFSEQLSQGDLYPRWLMNMNRGAGSPTFYFYAPVSYYIASLPTLTMTGQNLIVALAWGECILLALSGISFYWYARSRFSSVIATSCSMLYMLLPYHFETDLLQRQDIAELASYIWMPLLLYYTDELLKKRRGMVGLSATYALLVLSHLPSALISTICFAGYTLVCLPSCNKSSCLLMFFFSVALGLLLSGIYWVPALFSQKYVHPEAWWGSYFDFHRWFFPVRSTAFLKLSPTALPFITRLFFIVCLVAAMFFACWLAEVRRRKELDSQFMKGQLALAIVALFMMSSASSVVWEIVPELWKIQFPWRFFLILDFATALAALSALDLMYRSKDWIAGAALVTTIGLLVLSLATAGFRDVLDSMYRPWLLKTLDDPIRRAIDVPEYETKWNPANSDDISKMITGLDKVTYDHVNGSISIVRWKPRDIRFTANLRAPTWIITRQFYYPNWRARRKDGSLLPLVPEKSNGLILLYLPQGIYDVRLKLELSPEEQVGLLLTLSGVAVILFFSVGRRRYSGSKWRLDFRRFPQA